VPRRWLVGAAGVETLGRGAEGHADAPGRVLDASIRLAGAVEREVDEAAGDDARRQDVELGRDEGELHGSVGEAGPEAHRCEPAARGGGVGGEGLEGGPVLLGAHEEGGVDGEGDGDERGQDGALPALRRVDLGLHLGRHLREDVDAGEHGLPRRVGLAPSPIGGRHFFHPRNHLCRGLSGRGEKFDGVEGLPTARIPRGKSGAPRAVRADASSLHTDGGGRQQSGRRVRERPRDESSALRGESYDTDPLALGRSDRRQTTGPPRHSDIRTREGSTRSRGVAARGWI
jgi:hypothetical protein